MAIPVKADVSATERGNISRGLRLKVWELRGGICWRCGLPIIGHKEKWTVEHVIPLGLAGDDSIENMWPSHEHCRREKDKEDISKIAKTKRVKMNNLGIKKKSKWRYGKDSEFKRTVDGRVVKRQK